MIKTIILAVVQGLTEFLPVSSSGHLVLFSSFLKMPSDVFLYLVLHVGTLLSVLVFFAKDIMSLWKNKPLFRSLALATLITGTLGFLGRDFFLRFYEKVPVVAIALAVNGVLLIIANWRMKQAGGNNVSIAEASIMGLAQTGAIIPGISRSGSTISSLLLLGVKREEAFRFSFLASIPLIIAAFILEFYELTAIPPVSQWHAYGIGLAVAFITGLLSLWMLRLLMRKSRFDLFGYYCLTLSGVMLLMMMGK
jgi:undecaprenyl-diphosphatase